MGGRGGSSSNINSANSRAEKDWNRSIDNYSKMKDKIDRLNSSNYTGKRQFTANGKTATISHYTNKDGVRMYQVTAGKGENKEVSNHFTLADAKDTTKTKLGLF